MIKDPKTTSKEPNYNNYKTVKCKYYELNICKNGDNCTFAHGDDELKPLVRNNSSLVDFKSFCLKMKDFFEFFPLKIFVFFY